MDALEPFRVALTLCFTPAHLGLEEHHTSPPKDNRDFAVWAVSRYAPWLEPVDAREMNSRSPITL